MAELRLRAVHSLEGLVPYDNGLREQQPHTEQRVPGHGGEGGGCAQYDGVVVAAGAAAATLAEVQEAALPLQLCQVGSRTISWTERLTAKRYALLSTEGRNLPRGSVRLARPLRHASGRDRTRVLQLLVTHHTGPYLGHATGARRRWRQQ